VSKSREIKVTPPAKLNLFLHINDRRPDGYHSLQTFFRLIDLCDELCISARQDGQLHLATEQDGPADENLVLRAARLLREHVGNHDLGADFRLYKRIPLGGGLGGGSSDAAATLMALNRLWGLYLDTAELMALGLKLGADVPVFVRGQNALAEGLGERLHPVHLMEESWYVVVWPRVHVSTAELFADPDLQRNTPPLPLDRLRETGRKNDFEPLVRRRYPAIDQLMRSLNAYGAPRLTGSGSCVFLEVDAEKNARIIADRLPDRCVGFVARGINRSPVINQL
jgi:4-diphosphocytidyl-2-C-methyl-D-erythritol kinase